MTDACCQWCLGEFGGRHPFQQVLLKDPTATLKRRSARSNECLCCVAYIAEVEPSCCGQPTKRQELLTKVKTEFGRAQFLAGRSAWAAGKGRRGFGRPKETDESGERKRARKVVATEREVVSEETCNGVFWPREKYEAYFKKKTPRRQFTEDATGLRGIRLPSDAFKLCKRRLFSLSTRDNGGVAMRGHQLSLDAAR